jgi:Protein phosphatase 2C
LAARPSDSAWDGSPVFGRPSPAAALPWRLAPGEVCTAAFAGVRADGVDTDWCALRAATVVGVRHRLVGAGSQDAWAWGGDGRRVVTAVADGLGSYRDSGAVAAAVAEAAVAGLLELPSDGSAGDGMAGDGAAGEPAVEVDGAVEAAVVAVVAAVEAANAAVAGWHGGASTLVLAVVDPDGSVDLARVGDSTAFRLADGVWAEVFDRAAVDDELRHGATAALPSPAPIVESARCHLVPGEVLVLVTDGVGDPLRDGPTTVAPGLAAQLALPLHPLALAAQVDFSRQGCGDDRSALAVWFRPPASGPGSV